LFDKTKVRKEAFESEEEENEPSMTRSHPSKTPLLEGLESVMVRVQIPLGLLPIKVENGWEGASSLGGSDPKTYPSTDSVASSFQEILEKSLELPPPFPDEMVMVSSSGEVKVISNSFGARCVRAVTRRILAREERGEGN